MGTPDLVILTGAPGSGKTAILERLRGEVATVPEPARPILAEQRASGGTGTPDRDPARFVELLLERSVEWHREASASGGLVLFDRGIPDCVAYAVHLGTDPEPSRRAADRYRYRTEVLLLAPWDAIYSTDDERRMSFEQTLAFHDALVDAYRRSGYELVEVPRAPLDERVAFVRAALLDR
jgi:predicted ATPase